MIINAERHTFSAPKPLFLRAAIEQFTNRFQHCPGSATKNGSFTRSTESKQSDLTRKDQMWNFSLMEANRTLIRCCGESLAEESTPLQQTVAGCLFNSSFVEKLQESFFSLAVEYFKNECNPSMSDHSNESLYEGDDLSNQTGQAKVLNSTFQRM